MSAVINLLRSSGIVLNFEKDEKTYEQYPRCENIDFDWDKDDLKQVLAEHCIDPNNAILLLFLLIPFFLPAS